MEQFKAFRLRETGGKVSAAFESTTIAELDPGAVVIRVAYSSVNYKDALAVTGKGRIIRRFPCIAGIDLSGTVVESADARFKPGDRVIATSYDIGVAHDGGYAEYARIPAEWVVPLPAGMTLKESMIYGTAGFTAGLAIQRMQLNGLATGNGPVVVSGASGGVGSLAVAMLAKLGHQVVALTGKAEQADHLKALGASEVLLRGSIDFAKVRPLDRANWAGGIDNLGGETLAWMLATAKQGAPIGSIGLAQSADLKTTVMPFILRGVSLLGIDSGYTPMGPRAEVWRRLAGEYKPVNLDALTHVVPFERIAGTFDDFISAKVTGRIVVEMAGG